MLAGGNKQHGTIDKEYETAPTWAVEAVLLASTIDTEEVRDESILTYATHSSKQGYNMKNTSW